MKGLLLGCAMAVLPLCAQNEGEVAPILLYTQFVEPPPAAVLDSLHGEVQAIMAPMGMKFRWLDLNASDGKQVSVELAVIGFKGRCDVDGLTRHDSNLGALGWTHISDGVILPFANVDCSAVRSFIQRELLDTRVQKRAAVFGRALGRVLAHELYHIFANTTRHGSDGVARQFYSVHDLLTSDFQFEARESQALLHSRAHAALVAARPLPADDAEHFD